MVTLILILINTVVFLLIRTGRLNSDDLTMSYYTVSVQKDYMRILTSAFAHYDIYHFLTNMVSLFNIGSIVEDWFGPALMLVIYFGTMIFGKIMSLQIRHNRHDDYTSSLGASGAICGLLGAYIFVIMRYYGLDALQYIYRPMFSLVIMSILPGIDGTSHICCFSVGLVIAFLIMLLR